MKKIKKTDLKLDKEVISFLSENDLSTVKGGVVTETLNMCPIPADPPTKNILCDQSMLCFVSQKCYSQKPGCFSYGGCQMSVDICEYTEGDTFCKPVYTTNG